MSSRRRMYIVIASLVATVSVVASAAGVAMRPIGKSRF
jgi:hypothetical protein